MYKNFTLDEMKTRHGMVKALAAFWILEANPTDGPNGKFKLHETKSFVFDSNPCSKL